jgi:hypothetical protein
MARWRQFYLGWWVVLGCALAFVTPAAASRTAVVIALDGILTSFSRTAKAKKLRMRMPHAGSVARSCVSQEKSGL